MSCNGSVMLIAAAVEGCKPARKLLSRCTFNIDHPFVAVAPFNKLNKADLYAMRMELFGFNSS